MENNMFEPTPGAFKPSGFFDEKVEKEKVEEKDEQEETTSSSHS